MSKADEWSFEEIIASIEQFDLGTKIRSNTGDIYNLSQAEGEGKQRKFSRWDGTKLRFLTYENIGKRFEILEDNTEEIEELDREYSWTEGNIKCTWSKSALFLVDKINEIIRYIKRKDKNND